MKLTKQQVEALASTVTNRIVNEGQKFVETTTKVVTRQTKLTRAEEKELKTLATLSNKYGTDDSSFEELKRHVLKERVEEKVKELALAAGVNTGSFWSVRNDVENFIHLASIDVKDYDGLVSNLAQRLKIKLDND